MLVPAFMSAFAILYSLKCRSLPDPSSPLRLVEPPIATANACGVAASGGRQRRWLPYDLTIMADTASSTARRSRSQCPPLVAGGAKSPGSLKAAVERVHAAIPGSQLRWLEGQTHNLAAEPAAAMAKEFFLGR
jgi:pimeloyl-ACP methyl ester carboxylesterase